MGEEEEEKESEEHGGGSYNQDDVSYYADDFYDKCVSTRTKAGSAKAYQIPKPRYNKQLFGVSEVEESEELRDDEDAESNVSENEDEESDMDVLKPYNFEETMGRRRGGASSWFDILGEKEQKEMFDLEKAIAVAIAELNSAWSKEQLDENGDVDIFKGLNKKEEIALLPALFKLEQFAKIGKAEDEMIKSKGGLKTYGPDK